MLSLGHVYSRTNKRETGGVAQVGHRLFYASKRIADKIHTRYYY